METYCISCKKYTENPNVRKTKQKRLMVLSNCGICVKKPAFIKNQELNNFNNISDD